MSAARLLSSTWDWDPSVTAGCAALLAVYLLAHRRDLSRAGFFIAGDALMLLALVSPLDTLADTYLFSAHMLQHMILVLAVPPLLILGLSRHFADSVVSYAPLAGLERILDHPVVAWTLGVGMLWLWHAPSLYNATLAGEAVHIFEHLCFLVTATIFWWPIVAPLERSLLAPAPALLYLFTGALFNSLLGILLTFAPAGLYPAYLHPKDTLGILPLLRDSWGLTPQVDQQLGGLLMWVPGGLIFLAAMVGVLTRWYRAVEVEDLAPAAG